MFGCKCFVLNNGKDNLGKFDPKSDEEILIGYALNKHAYKIYNRTLLATEEFVHVIFYGTYNYMLKPVEDELESGDLKTILQKNQLIDSETTDSILAEGQAVNPDFPENGELQEI